MGDFSTNDEMSSRSSFTPFKNFHLEVFESDEDEDVNEDDCNAGRNLVTLDFNVSESELAIDTLVRDEVINDISKTNRVKKSEQRPKLKRKLKSGGIKGRPKKIRKTSTKNSGKNELFNQLNQILQKELDTIDTKASDSKLTVANVKDILKTVITNDQVVAMVRQQVNENPDKSTELEDPYSFGLAGLKLTRSKTKELLATKPEMAWPLTPAKRVPQPTECQFLIEQDLPEDSSDEEYQPNEAEIEADREETASEWDVGSQPATPGAASTPRPASNLDCSTQTSWTEDGTFRVPAENIGQRTRSKLSLSDTALETIEKAFIPPDITTDMYDLVCDDDDWRDFLNKFTEPMRPTTNEAIDDDDEADPEYNLLADEDREDVDQEELRMDRGVKVSKRELNELMTELFDMYDNEVPSTSRTFTAIPAPEAIPFEPSPSPPEEEEAEEESLLVQLEPETSSEFAALGIEELPQLSEGQIELLRQHMRKHVQLTAQHFVQTYGHPLLSEHAPQCKEQLVTLKCLAGKNVHSVFNCENLDPALQLIDNWQAMIDTDPVQSADYVAYMKKEIKTSLKYRKMRRKYTCEFSIQTLDILSNTTAVIFPLLLPEVPFRCDGYYRSGIFDSEEHLLAIGLEQFIPFVKSLRSQFKSKFDRLDAVTLVQKHLVPGHDTDYLLSTIKKRKCSTPGPIKYYFDHKLAPGTDHFVIKFSANQLKTLQEQPPELLPDAWQEYVFPSLKYSHRKRIY